MQTSLALDGADPLAHAIAYARLGWRVVPILPGQKRPALDRWTERATTDPELIAQWWQANPAHGVGIATGALSGIFALDVDPAHGGTETLAALEATYGRLPDTVEAITGGGGRHLLFWWPKALTDGQRLSNSAGRLGPGLDVRAEGGQIVVAPTLHPTSGRRYEWELSSRPGEAEVAEAPGWLLELLLETTTPLPDGQIDDQGRYDTRFAWDHVNAAGNGAAIALLQEVGWHSPRQDREGTWYLTRPGKSAGEGSGVSVGRIGPGIVYCFTSEAPPLEAEHGYRPAELYALFHHGGDRGAADAELCRQTGLAPTYAIDPADLETYVRGEHAKAVAMGWARDDVIEAEARAKGELREAHEFLSEPEEPYDWLVEGLIERGDRLILTGPEGGGKSTLLRQMAVQIAAGVHPFDGGAFAPAKVLIVDCENSPRHIKRKLRGLVELAGPRLEEGRLWIVPKPEGIDLGTLVDVAWLDAIAAEVEPELLIIGPIYKMSDGDPIEEGTAKVVIRAIDMLRARYDCAVLIEAHTPHESKTERPYGASIWKRWPEFGLFLDRAGPLRHWRGARDERQWPAALMRGQGPTSWPWERATDKAITFVKMMEIQRAAGRKMSYRAIAEALQAQGIAKGDGTSHVAVGNAIRANLGQWNDLLAELGFEVEE